MDQVGGGNNKESVTTDSPQAGINRDNVASQQSKDIPIDTVTNTE